MRFSLKIAFALIVGLATLDLVLGQQPGTGFGGLQGLLGGKQQQDIEALLHNASVKKEIKLTEEQEAKVPAAILEALAKVLTPDQLKRFKQIELQSRDYTVFGDPRLQELLQMTDGQKADIKVVLADADKQTKDLTANLQGAIGGGGKGFGGGKGMGGVQDKVQAIAKAAKENCLETLTAEQKRTWNELLGDTFTVEQPALNLKGINLNGLDLNDIIKNLDLKGIDLKNFGKKKGG